MKTTSLFAIIIIFAILVGTFVPVVMLIALLVATLFLLYTFYAWISPFQRSKHAPARYTHYPCCHYSFESIFTWLVPFSRVTRKRTITMKGYISPYTIQAMQDNDTIHKLMGVSYKGGVHKNSVRLGYSHVDNNNIALHIYAYKNGKRKTQFLGYIKPMEEITMTIINHQIISVTSGGKIYGEFGIYKNLVLCDYTIPQKTSFLLLPYFGGKEKPLSKCYSFVQFS